MFLLFCIRFLLTHHRHNLNDTKISYDSWSIPIVIHRNKRPRRQRWVENNVNDSDDDELNKIKFERKRQFPTTTTATLPCGASKNTKMKNLWFLNLTVCRYCSTASHSFWARSQKQPNVCVSVQERQFVVATASVSMQQFQWNCRTMRKTS